MWRKVDDPVVRFKDAKGGDRGTLSVIGGSDSPVAFIVDVDYGAREYIIWFQGLDDDDGPGEEVIRLPWLESNPWAFEAWDHRGRLKIAFKQYESPDLGNHRRLGVYDSGYADL
jgi:hypothetical protein